MRGRRLSSESPGRQPARLARTAARTIGTIVLSALCLSFPPPAHADAPETQLTTLESELAQNPIWLALLHQSRRKLNAKTRAALHETHFFFHAEGATRPDLELAATRDAFVQSDSDRARTERCRFPARHQFLAEHGVVPPERGACPEFDPWRAQIGEVVLTLAFPEAFLGNPSSMFGHSLLRFDPILPADQAEDVGGDLTNVPAESLLGWTLDYTADATDEVSAIYMIRGLIGGYRGHFGISPYYEKTKQYGDWQDRDIWEYPLDMPAAGRERVLLHIWELRDVTLPYYFFTQNCSEKLLEVLEVGWPGIGRGGGFPPAVTPVDTLRAIAAMSDTALGEPRLRASPATKIQEGLARLQPVRRELVLALADGRVEPEDPSLDALPADQRGETLTLAYDVLRHNFLAGGVSEEDSRPRSIALLRARSRVDAKPAPERPLESLDRTPPHEGHGTARVALTGGIQDKEGFVELRVLPAYHTTLDAPGGFAEGGEIKVLDTALRYYPELDRVRLHEVVLLDITTASPWRKPFRPLGWHTEIGVRTRMVSSDRDRGLDTESVFRAQGGLGAALAPASRLHLYAFGEVLLEAGPGLEGDAVAGPLARAGLSWSTKKGEATVRLEGLAGALLGKDPSEWLRVRLDTRISITPKWSAVLGGHFDRAYDVGHFEGRFGLTRYF